MRRAILFCLCSMHALNALPVQGEVSQGCTILHKNPKSLEVYADGRTEIQWDQFDLSSEETISFFQREPEQPILNRIAGTTPSQILGKLQANCPIYFIDQNGLYIGSSAHLEATGWIASTADISEARFWSGEPLLFEPSGEGAIVHLGSLVVKGTCHLEAKKIHLGQSARLDVSSAYTPGTIRGNAATVQVDEGALLAANALVSGNGGEIALVAQESMLFEGFAQVQGGPERGNGGTIRISSSGSHFQLGRRPIVDATALNGKSGQVIFDPKNISISPDGMDLATDQTFDANPADTAVISGATLQMALDAAQVTLQANTDISFNDEVIVSTEGNGLTLQAGRSIVFNGLLTLNNADFLATINDSSAIAEDRDAGIATFSSGSASQISTQGGNITCGVGTFNGIQEGEISIFGTILDAGGGDIALTGLARRTAQDNTNGITISSGSLLQTSGSGTVTLTGTGGNGANINIGVYLSDPSTRVQVEEGLLHLVGHGGGTGAGNGNAGIFSAATLSSIGSGPILLDGFGGSGVHFNMGVILSGGQINTIDSDLTLNGTGVGTGAMNFGVRFESNAQCQSTGSGAIVLSGTASSNGKNNNHGVILSGGTLSANTGSILITGIGRGTQNYNYGIRLETGAQCISTGTAPITLEGQNSVGLSGNAGISISTGDIAISSSYGDIQMTGTSNGTGSLNQGIRIESGRVLSTGTGMGAAHITLVGVGGSGTSSCNGIDVQGEQSEVSAVDGNILVDGTSSGNGTNNQPIVVNPPTQVNTTGMGTVTYVEH